jgi:predicted Zn-dependent peptidase
MTNTIDRRNPPPIKDAVDFNLQLKPCDKYVLKNGVEVYAINAGAEDVLQIEWVFKAGNSYEKQNLIAASTNFLLKNGTSKKNAFELNEHFEYYGSYLNRHCYNETASVSLHSLSKHLENLLPVVKEILSDSVFRDEEISVYKQNMKQRLNVNLKKCDFVANRLIDTFLYGQNHPYGRFTRYEDFDSITREELLEFYTNYYIDGKLVIFAAGRLPANLFSLLDQHFGDLKNLPINTPNIQVSGTEEKKHRITNDPDGVQGAIRLGTNFPNRHHPEFLPAQILNNLFGGFFGSRLMSNIREDKGYTYGIHSYIQNHVQETAWLISTEAGRDVCEATITEVYKEMEILRNEPIDDDELLLVRNYMMGSILGELDGPFQIISRWKNIVLNDLSEEYFYRSINTIKTVTAKELQELANKYLLPEKFYELVVV